MCWNDAQNNGTSPWALKNAVRSGSLLRVFPGIYADPELAKQQSMRWIAAERYLAGRGLLSHTTALSIWRVGWHEPENRAVHVSVAPEVRLRSTKGLVVHRRGDIAELGKHRRGGHWITSISTSLVDSWPLLKPADRTGLVIDIVTGGHTTTGGVAQALDRVPKLKDAKELRRLLALIEAGCHSPLELWGALNVFVGPGMPALRRQVPIRAGGRGYILDLLAVAERVNFELDGAAFHGDAIQRENDLRRDAALATRGILVVRFSYSRLMSEPDAVRREVISILSTRRA